jgi:hypothetical protein
MRRDRNPESRKYGGIARDARRLLDTARALHFRDSALSHVLRCTGHRPQVVVKALTGLSRACDEVAAAYRNPRPKRAAGPKPDRHQAEFLKMVAVIAQRHGVHLSKHQDGKYVRVVELLYKAMGFSTRPAIRTLKPPIEALLSQRYTWCDYEVGEVRFTQHLRSRADATR